MEMPPSAPVLTRLRGTSELSRSLTEPNPGPNPGPNPLSWEDFELYYSSSVNTLEEPQVSSPDWGLFDLSSLDDPTAAMLEPSLWLSPGRNASPLSPYDFVVAGHMPSTSPGKEPCSPEGEAFATLTWNAPMFDYRGKPLRAAPRFEYRGKPLRAAPMFDYRGKPHSYLHIARQCCARVQKMPSRKFNNEQCGYLAAKLKVILESATSFLFVSESSTPDDTPRCIEVFKLFLALALKIESYVQGCSKNEWLQAATTLTNTAEYVSSLGFNLELCEAYFIANLMGWTEAKALTAAQAHNIERNEVEIVKRKASLDVDVLLDKVILELPSLQAEQKDLAIYLLQRLRRLKPVSNSRLPESPFWSAFDDLAFGSAFQDLGFLGRIFQLVRPTELLGKGTSATVHKALWLGTPVAKKTFYGPEHPDYLREAQILGRLCHPNIMSMFCCAMDKRKCSIVMELMDEDLHSFMQRRLDTNPLSPPFSVFEAVDVILQIGEGVNYLHENGIVHRDLKSFNILVKNVLPADLEVQYVLIKVADFGFAKIKESSTRYSNQTLNIGTNRWMPPEVISFRNNDGQASTSVLQAGPKYPKKSDVYSFGMVCYEILTGDVPFPQEASLVNIKKMVLKGKRPTLPDYCPLILKDLIEACWDPEPTNRPSFASICLALKHLKCLLIGGFNSDEDSYLKIGEPLPMAPENTLFGAPPREMELRKRPVQGGLHEVLSKKLKAVEA